MKNIMASISVIIPLYNGDKYIKNTIQKIINQTFRNWELIIVDDGSADNGLKTVKEMQKTDNRIKIYEKKNGGICSARNYGIQMATSEFLSFVDQDDEPYPNMLEDLLSGMTDSIDMVVAGQELSLISENEIVKKKYIKVYHDFIIDDPEEIARFIFNRYNDASAQHVWNCLYRHRIIEKENIKFDEVYKYGMEDIMFNIEYAVHCRAIHKISSIVYSYNRRIGISTSTKKNPDAYADFEHGLRRIRDVVELDSIYKEQLYTLYAIRSVLHTYCKNNFVISEKVLFDNFRKVYMDLTRVSLSWRIDNTYFNIRDFIYYILDKSIRNRIYILFRLLRPIIK